MSIRDVRVLATSAVRCVGNTLLLHGGVYSPPFRIAAIGDPTALQQALDDSEGVQLFRDAVTHFQLGYQQTVESELGVPAFFQSTSSSTFRYATGERIGNIYGKKFVTSCSELPAPFNTQCGPGQEFQHNDQGFVVWVGEGNTWEDGFTKDLWGTTTNFEGYPVPVQWGHPIVAQNELTGLKPGTIYGATESSVTLSALAERPSHCSGAMYAGVPHSLPSVAAGSPCDDG